MKKSILFLSLVVLFLGSCNIPYSFIRKSPSAELKTDEPGGLQQWEADRVKNPITGAIPKQNLVDVYNDYLISNKDMQAPISGVTWQERGPNNIGGRTRVILFDKNDTSDKTVFAASVGGGLFKCTDIDATTPTWSKVNDFFSNLAITCMAQNPLYPDTMYFGTGEGFGNADAIAGAGVWRSVNGGATWTQLGSVMSGSVPVYINRLAITSTGVVYAATSSGLFKSTNGNSWTAVLRTSGTTPTVGSNTGMDVKVAANDDIYYSCNAQVWKYTASSGTWSNVTPSGSFARIEIACSPSNSNYLYLLCQSASSSAVTGFFSSSNGASSYRSRSVPLIYDQAATASTELSRNQAWYDLSLAVDPNTPTTVYAGAIEYIKSTDTGATYKQITAWSLYAMPTGANLGTAQLMHSDHHVLAFKPGSSSYALMGGDGGIYKSVNMTNNWPSVPSYTTINTNFNVTQFYSCAIANVASSNNFIAGAQDNGSLKFNAAGINAVTAVSGGDGCFVFIDQDNSNNQITSYVYNNYYVSTNATSFSTLSGSNNTGDFVNPGDLDGTNNILYTKGGSNVLSRWTNVFGTPTRTNLTISGISGISHIKVSPNNPTTVYLGTTGGNIYRIANANTASSGLTPTALNSTAFGGRISSIEVRKCTAATDDTILVTQSNYGLSNSVLYTLNSTAATPTWTDVDDNSSLPDIPVNWSLFAPTSSANSVILATEMGIYTCDNIYASTPVWGQSNTGFANVRVDMLKYRTSDSLIAAATHGRGLFTSDKYCSPKAAFTANKTWVYTSQSIQFSDASYKATSWEWDFDNNGSIDATTQNPTWAYGTGGLKTVSLRINGLYTVTQTNLINVLPNLAVPYTLAQGGDFETNASDFIPVLVSGVNWERGSSSITAKSGTKSGSFAWVTGLTASNYSNYNETYLYTPCFNLVNASNDSIKFYIKNAFETGYDGMRVEYSLDKGNNWTPLSTSTATNWYDFANSTTTTSFPQNQAYFNATNSAYTLKKYSISSLNGNANVSFRFVFKSDYTSTAAGVAIDNFEIVSSTTTQNVKNIETTATSKAEYFGPSATVDFYSPNGKLLATLVNNSAHNYGLTTVTIDNAGTGAMNYANNTANNKKISQKTLAISPTTNNTSGSYTATLYYTASEINGWKSATGNNFSSANIIKCPVNIASGDLSNGVYGASKLLAVAGDGDSSITATFTTGFSGFGMGNGNTVLPIDLLSFEVFTNRDDVKLLWSTASERNNQLFEIEKSSDGVNFFKINEVLGAGNSYIQKDYTYHDVNAFNDAKIVYYRLKQIDFSGAHQYSPIRVASHAATGDIVLRVAPQPMSQVLNITTNCANGFEFGIYGMDGRNILSGKSSSPSVTTDVSKLANGNYILKVQDAAGNLRETKIVKVGE